MQKLKIFNFFDEENNFIIVAKSEQEARKLVIEDYGFDKDYPLELWGEYEIKEDLIFTI